MGNLCTKHIEKLQDEIEPEIVLKSYKSSQEKYFADVENKYNMLKYFQLYDYVNLIANTRVEYKYSEIKDDNLHRVIKEDFAKFIDLKIVNNFLIKNLLNDKSLHIEIFQDYMIFLFEQVENLYKLMIKHKSPEVTQFKKKDVSGVRKIHLYIIGFLFASSSIRMKMELLYSLLVNENRRISFNPVLEDFFFFLFAIPSYASIASVDKLGSKYKKEIIQMNDEELLDSTEAFEIKDIFRLRDLFLKDFFAESNGILNKDQFEAKFTKNDHFRWIFSSKGIRENLEKNNIKEESNK